MPSWRVRPLHAGAALVVALLLCGCGGGTDSPDRPAATADATATAPPPTGPAVAPTTTRSPDREEGGRLYRAHCLACHGQPTDRRAGGAAGDPAAVRQAIASVRVMRFLDAEIGPAQADALAAWLLDPR